MLTSFRTPPSLYSGGASAPSILMRRESEPLSRLFFIAEKEPSTSLTR
jgi:hypothetical protein